MRHRPPLHPQGFAAAVVNLTGRLVPPPQRVQALNDSAPIPVNPGWVIATDLSDSQNAFAADDLAAALANITGGIRFDVLDSKAIAVGVPGMFIAFATSTNDPIVTEQLALRNGSLDTLGIHAGPEAYVLVADRDAVVVVGTGAAGTFYGLQTLAQIWDASVVQNNCTKPCTI